jgi:tRNA-2-methylthio-N6-dimethylallyladenosine synthase
MSEPTRKVFIKTHGCQMNVYDSGRMADALRPAGYAQTGTIDDADLVLINTCHIREKASDKVYSEIGRLRVLKDQRRAAGRDMTIGIAGCVAQAEGKEILRRAPSVDVVVGPQGYHRLPDLLERAKRQGRAIDVEFSEDDKFDHLPATDPRTHLKRGPAAFLTIQEGCDKFCSFCVVPYTRGMEVSRPMSQILAEARAMVEAGVREITLLGQNVNAYHGANGSGGEANLGDLLFALARIDGVKRLRYTTSHPNDMHDTLYAAHRDLRVLTPLLHLPVQSGSDAMLKAMNRKHTVADYHAVLDRMNMIRDDMAFSSDFIVAHPGETDADFAATLALVERVGYASCYSFKYSARPGTPAAERTDLVAPDIANARLQTLQTLLNDQETAFLKGLVGKTIDVLFEREGREAGQIVGRSPYVQPVQVNAPAGMIGQIGHVTITSTGTHSLFGHLASAPAEVVSHPLMEVGA